MSTRIILIRHGETLWNIERRCQGFTDIGLSETGREQASRLAQALGHKPLSAVYSSDLIRAHNTAEMIAEPHRLIVRTDARLRELNQGACEGKTMEELLTDHTEMLRAWMDQPADVAMPDGESIRKLQARGWQAIEDIVAAHQQQMVVVLGHNLLNSSIICKVLGLDLNRFRSLRQNIASLNEIEFTPHGPVLIRLNDTHHLK